MGFLIISIFLRNSLIFVYNITVSIHIKRWISPELVMPDEEMKQLSFKICIDLFEVLYWLKRNDLNLTQKIELGCQKDISIPLLPF